MFQFNRTAALIVALLGAVTFLMYLNGSLDQGMQSIRDVFDRRTARTALFIGNSRTFYHDMPAMVRRIADSANYPERLDITMDAQPRVSLADHLANPKSQALIARGWDHVVLQVLSSEQYSEQQPGQVWETAAKLIGEVRANGAVPAMFVTWRYTAQCQDNAGLPPSAIGLPTSGYANMHVNIQRQHARLADLTGVDLVNVGQVWEGLQDKTPGFTLYDDCNHPSIYGSYLSALMFYAYFSKRDVADVSFVPAGISAAHADFIKAAVSKSLAQPPRT